jgi:chromate reductase, NAD(P)H dehydrogenase (quinone)
VLVLGISGSLRQRSHNTALLRAAAKAAPEGVELRLYDGLGSLPPYNEDHDTDTPPAAVVELRELIADADALLISTPEYNGTVPGQLKHALDWASRPRGSAVLAGKPVAVIGASTSEYGALWAQDHLRKALGIAGARVLDTEFPGGRVAERIGPDGELADDDTVESLLGVVEALAEQQRELVAA